MKLAVVTAILAVSSNLHADDSAAEAALRRFFEGHAVVVRVDMPATSSGIDVYPEREYPLDVAKAADRVRGSGLGVREGDRIRITRLKLKDDLIEFQLGGGGFNAFTDGSGTVSPHLTPESRRERELDREIDEEKDSRRKNELRRQRDHLRRERENRDAQARAIADEANEIRRDRDRQRALDLGSRFNIRFEKKDVPFAYRTPEGVMRALASYVDFLDLGPRLPERPEDLRVDRDSPTPRRAGEDGEAARKGMTRAEVEELYGRPLREDETLEGSLRVRVASYRHGTERIEVTYVDDVAVRVAPLAR